MCTHLWKKRSPLGSAVTWSVWVSSWLFLNHDTWAAGLLYGGLQVRVTSSPLCTVTFVGCWSKLQSISGNAVIHLCVCVLQVKYKSSNILISKLSQCFSLEKALNEGGNFNTVILKTWLKISSENLLPSAALSASNGRVRGNTGEI